MQYTRFRRQAIIPRAPHPLIDHCMPGQANRRREACRSPICRKSIGVAFILCLQCNSPGREAKDDAVCLGELLRSDDGHVGFGGGMHLAEHFLRQQLRYLHWAQTQQRPLLNCALVADTNRAVLNEFLCILPRTCLRQDLLYLGRKYSRSHTAQASNMCSGCKSRAMHYANFMPCTISNRWQHVLLSRSTLAVVTKPRKLDDALLLRSSRSWAESSFVATENKHRTVLSIVPVFMPARRIDWWTDYNVLSTLGVEPFAPIAWDQAPMSTHSSIFI